MDAVIDLKEAVQKTLAGSGSRVREAVVEKLVGEEVEMRVKTVVTALAKADDFQKKFDNLKPQPLSFDADGKPIQTGFTAQQNGERKKFKEQLDRLTQAMGKAFQDQNPDWEPLKKLAAGNDKEGEKGN